jgi:hypothetical protein
MGVYYETIPASLIPWIKEQQMLWVYVFLFLFPFHRRYPNLSLL